MGWKNIKEHYRIAHQVQVTSKGICIGSDYIHDLIVIGLDGTIVKRYDGSENDELYRYQTEMDSDPALLRRLLGTADTFAVSIPVYTPSEDGRIIEKLCEVAGWPNVTHDGCLMHDNTYSTDKDAIVARAKHAGGIAIKHIRRIIGETEKQLADWQERLAQEEAAQAELEATYPGVTVPIE